MESPISAAAAAALTMLLPGDLPHGPRLSPAGLVAETTSRPGRRVRTWLAWPAQGSADSEPQPIGLATLVLATTTAGRRRFSISWLLVHPSGRRQGLGRALVAAVLAAARQEGASDVWVETRSDWGAACCFWQACGFTEPSPPSLSSPPA